MKLKQLFDEIKRKRRNNLTELESREVLTRYDIPIVKGQTIKSIEEAKTFVEKTGYPVVLKVLSPQIIHKTEVGGVILNIKNEKELFEAYHQIIKNIEKTHLKLTLKYFSYRRCYRVTEKSSSVVNTTLPLVRLLLLVWEEFLLKFSKT